MKHTQMNYGQTKKRILVAGMIISILALLCFSNTSLAVNLNDQTITFINVGQGDSTLISDGNGFIVLIDGGKPEAGPSLVGHIHAQGISNINVVVATHADSDHIGGLINLLNDNSISVGRLLYNGYPGSTTTWTNFADAVSNKGLSLTSVQFPQVLSWGKLTAHVMNPASGLSNPETNDASIVVLVDYVNTKYLFTGDIDSTIEATILARGTSITADILKVAHHGSEYSSSDTFLATVQPKNGVISVGPNSYGHPSSLTINRLETAGAHVWRTDKNGDIVLSNNGSTYSILPQFQDFFNYVYMPLIRKEVVQITPTPITPTPITPTPITPTPITPTPVTPTPVTPTPVTPTQVIPTPVTPTTTPPPPIGSNVQCNTIDSAQICAWVSNGAPIQNSTVTVYGRLYINNVAQASQNMTTTWHYKSTNSACSGTTDSSGVATCSRSIGLASKGYQVNIDVTIGGYTATTWFTPN